MGAVSEAPDLHGSPQLGTGALAPSSATLMAVFSWSCESPFGLELWQATGITAGVHDDPMASDAVGVTSPLPFLLPGRLCGGSANGCEIIPLEQMPLSVAMAVGGKAATAPTEVAASARRSLPQPLLSAYHLTADDGPMIVWPVAASQG